METNGINEAVWLNKQVLLRESSSTIQYQETHIEKKRKLLLTDGEESGAPRIEATYDQNQSQRQLATYGVQNLINTTLENTSFMHNESIMTETEMYSRLNCSQQDIMGNLFGSSSLSEEESGESSKSVNKVKKKKKKRHRDREKGFDSKKDLIDLDSSSLSSDENKPKDPRIGSRYQCDMSVLKNGEGDRVEFIGEKMWDPSKVNLAAVVKFLQDIQLPRPLINQFDFVPFSEYNPVTSIISQDKLLAQLMRFNYNFEKTRKYLIDQKLSLTDRGFAVRQQWRSLDIKIFEKTLLKSMIEQEGDFDLGAVKRALHFKPMNQICEFYFAWKHSKRFQVWKDEAHCPVREKRRDRGNLRPTKPIDYNDQTSVVLRNLDRQAYKIPKKPWEDSKVIQASNEGDSLVYSIIINVQINDHEFERKNCLEKCITKKNLRADKHFLEYT
jgi:hypothetical protein